jgi:hypothetical protein
LRAGVERGDSAARHARATAIGAAGQDNWDASPQHDPGGIGKKCQLLGEHVASLEVGDEKNVGVAVDLDVGGAGGRIRTSP